jgi:hypothetical protein
LVSGQDHTLDDDGFGTYLRMIIFTIFVWVYP